MKRMMLGAVWLALCLSGQAHATKTPWEEYDKRIERDRSVSALGNDLFGDSVDLQNGALSFSTTDVSLAGNNGLRVELTRTYKMFNRKDYGTVGMMGDWDIAVPNISGVFAPNWTSGDPSYPDSRCSVMGAPYPPKAGILVSDFWSGNNLEIPGVGGGELLMTKSDVTRPGSGETFRYIAGNQIHIACLPSIKNGSGEGFLAVTPDGTRYWFDWMAQYVEPVLKGGSRILGLSGLPVTARRKNVLYATRVEDRFGNRVEYTYSNAWNDPGKLTSVVATSRDGSAADGRRLTINWNGSQIGSVSDGVRTWTYSYVATPHGRQTLARVVQPDGNDWVIGFSALTDAEIKYYEYVPVGETIRSCLELELAQNEGAEAEPVGTIAHPSGALGAFKMGLVEHSRSNVPIACGNVTSSSPDGGTAGNDPNDDINTAVISYRSFSLIEKKIEGPGLPVNAWGYAYSSTRSIHFFGDANRLKPTCNWSQYNCSTPICTSDDCAGVRTLTVTAPNGDWTRYVHGNSYMYNDGKLLRVEHRNDAGFILSATQNTYDLSFADQAYPAFYGVPMRGKDDAINAVYHRPLKKAEVNQQGATFDKVVDSFDYFARPLQVTLSSSLGYSRSETTAYQDDTTRWVLGQVRSTTCLSPANCAGMVVAQTDYDPAMLLPVRRYAFGRLEQAATYNLDGTVATVADGNGNTTTLGSWKRGVPQSVTYPVTPESPNGAVESVTVNDAGWITAVTDEAGFTTGYGYDAMGRISSIAYPGGDGTAWKGTSLAFEKVGMAEYGIAANHWRQTVATGNARKITYFDGLWHPLLTREYDAANEAATQRFQRFAYDHEGRTTFTSYPGSSDALTAGTWTEYDALGRPTSASQDSEQGLLTTVTEYLPGNQTRVTDPRGFQTVTGYQVFDQPNYDAPVWILHPEGARTDISRDVFGKVQQITRQAQ